MTWHTSTTTCDLLEQVVREIRRQGGTIARCQRCSAGLIVTWFTR